MKSPWKFWQVRDTRTVYDLAGLSLKDLDQSNQHHALHDCLRQIDGIKRSLEKLKNILLSKE